MLFFPSFPFPFPFLTPLLQGTAGPAAQGGGNHLAPISREAPSQAYGGGDPAGSDMSRVNTLKRGFNRFSAFVKAGAEAYLLGTMKEKNVDAHRVLHIEVRFCVCCLEPAAHGSPLFAVIVAFAHLCLLNFTCPSSALKNLQSTGDGPAWMPPEKNYGHITVSHQRKDTKYGGVKSFDVFTVAMSNVQVERRFKHFEWLHDRLTDAYPCLAVPPLPGKDYDPKFGASWKMQKERSFGAPCCAYFCR